MSLRSAHRCPRGGAKERDRADLIYELKEMYGLEKERRESKEVAVRRGNKPGGWRVCGLTAG